MSAAERSTDTQALQDSQETSLRDRLFGDERFLNASPQGRLQMAQERLMIEASILTHRPSQEAKDRAQVCYDVFGEVMSTYLSDIKPHDTRTAHNTSLHVRPTRTHLKP